MRNQTLNCKIGSFQNRNESPNASVKNSLPRKVTIMQKFHTDYSSCAIICVSVKDVTKAYIVRIKFLLYKTGKYMKLNCQSCLHGWD